MEYLPESDPDVQESDASNCSPNPSGSNYSLQGMDAGLARGVDEKIVIAPVAQHPKCALRDPWQEHKHDADFQAENDIENYA